MEKEDKEVRNEVEFSFKYLFLLSDWLGMKMRPDESVAVSSSFLDSLKTSPMYYLTLSSSVYALFGLILFVALHPDRSFSVEFLVPKIHIIGYTVLGLLKGYLVFTNLKSFREHVHEVFNLWPRHPMSSQSLVIKESSVWRLRIIHSLYVTVTLFSVGSFMMLPVLTRLYKHFRGEVYVKTLSFDVWFPVNMTAPGYYELCLLLTNWMGITSTLLTLNTNVLITGLSNHLCMFFQMLQEKIRGLRDEQSANNETFEDYKFWIEVIKRHQILINYIDRLEKLFSVVFFAQFMLSSVDICCAGFAGLIIDVKLMPSNLTFIISHLGEMGLLCWYGDDVYRESMKISEAVYESDWCRSSPRSKKLMLFIMIRAQKPLQFTALKFKDINLITFSGIVVTSYSYFTLLLNVY